MCKYQSKSDALNEWLESVCVFFVANTPNVILKLNSHTESVMLIQWID